MIEYAHGVICQLTTFYQIKYSYQIGSKLLRYKGYIINSLNFNRKYFIKSNLNLTYMTSVG